ncbi:MAG: hypothetical protein L0G05_10725 [Chryseobacterium sp.]|nr:hypothetical protein [Chryseobacterium sp.]
MNYVTQSNGEAAQLSKEVTQVVANDVSLTANDSGKIFLVGTDAKTITLPATQSGLVYTFVNIGAAGNNIIKVSPAAADGISGTVTLASSVVVFDGTVNKAALNTKATTQAGDSMTIVGTGVTGAKAWIILSATGIWAKQA